jgi:hypothetical protein
MEVELPKKSRKKRKVSRPRSHNLAQSTVNVKPTVQAEIRVKDDLDNPSRYTQFRSEIKMMGIISGLILITIFILYFLLR